MWIHASALCLLLSLLVVSVAAQATQVSYHMGGSLTNGQVTTFTFVRDVNTTTITWKQFGAEANGSGVVTTKSSDAYPSGYEMSNLYRGLSPVGLIRWSYIYQNKVATVQIRNTDPVVTVLPTDASSFAAGQIVTVRAGSVTFANVDVNLNGQPGTIGGLLSTLSSSTSATTAASFTTATAAGSTFSTSATTVRQNPSSATAMAVGISLPLGFVLMVMVGLGI